MIKNVLIALYFIIFIQFSFSQTLTIQPGPASGKDSRIFNMSCGLSSGLGCDTTNYGNDAFFQANAWTFSGNFAIIRSFLEFDLSAVNFSSSSVTSATLFLFFPPDQITYESQSHLSGSNSVNIDRVAQPWLESKINWTNQPNVINSNLSNSENRVTIPADTSSIQDFSIDLTSMFKFWLNNPSQNFGIRLALATELNYRRMTFATSDHSIVTIRPKLVIKYNNSENGIIANKIKDIGFYTNPVHNSLNIKLTELGRLVKVDIYSMDGRIVLSKSIDNVEDDFKLPISELKIGTYLMRISDERGIQLSNKIIVIN